MTRDYAYARYWMLTIPEDSWSPPDEEDIPSGVAYIKGQLEIGEETGYRHWQLLVVFSKKVRMLSVKTAFCRDAYCAPSRSVAADAYVWKEETSVEGTRFSLGRKPHRANVATDWDQVWEDAIKGNIIAVPAHLRIQHYRTLRTIRADYAAPVAGERTCSVYYGPTGTGKSRRAWEEAGMDAYPKSSRSKFWDGYRDQPNVVMDEFRGGVDYTYLLRWIDRYPCLVDIKGSAVVLRAEHIWITSNVHPRLWYPELDETTYLALERRMNIELIE